MVSLSRDLPAAVRELVSRREVKVVRVASLVEAREPGRLSEADALLVCDPNGEMVGDSAGAEAQLLADALISHRLMGVVLSPGTSGVVPGDGEALAVASGEVSADELWGRLVTIRDYRPQLLRMESQLVTMQRLGKQLNQYFVEVDRELHLASRLQRNFLPQSLPEIGDIRFATLYRPASWISGDDYDVRRLDESHIGFFLADAVGHGVAAGLLTMFIKQAIVGKRVTANDYTIVPPGEALAVLNRELAAQELPNCQFITACYGYINVQTHTLTFARGGHPHPIHVAADGSCGEVRVLGGLLGVFQEEEFPSLSLCLGPGEKLVLYSDGLEDVIVSGRQRESGDVHFTPAFLDSVRLPAESCVRSLADHLDCSEGSLQPGDDQTCLIIERLAGNQ